MANILTFDFMAPPPRDSLLRAVEQLYLLDTVEKLNEEEGEKKDGEGMKGEKKGSRGKQMDTRPRRSQKKMKKRKKKITVSS